MQIDVQDSSVVELIQLSLAPVFLIVGVGQMINAVTGRLARIIDRARWYDEKKRLEGSSRYEPHEQDELRSLRKRMKFANWAITFLTLAAAIICIDVVLLFINGLITLNLEIAILGLFIFSLFAITCGITSFFMEVSIANATLKIPNLPQLQIQLDANASGNDDHAEAYKKVQK